MQYIAKLLSLFFCLFIWASDLYIYSNLWTHLFDTFLTSLLNELSSIGNNQKTTLFFPFPYQIHSPISFFLLLSIMAHQFFSPLWYKRKPQFQLVKNNLRSKSPIDLLGNSVSSTAQDCHGPQWHSVTLTSSFSNAMVIRLPHDSAWINCTVCWTGCCV